MKFMVSRTSSFEGKPCKEAIFEKYVRVDRRAASTPEEIPAFKNYPNTDWWYKEGRNHRKIGKNTIARDFDDDGWFIEVNSIDELMKLQKKYGEFIIKGPYWGTGYDAELEIYDDYRE